MFNLGVALVASGKASKGSKKLQLIIPEEDDYLFAGDLWYNKCNMKN